jgi:hypothetical protein
VLPSSSMDPAQLQVPLVLHICKDHRLSAHQEFRASNMALYLGRCCCLMPNTPCFRNSLQRYMV